MYFGWMFASPPNSNTETEFTMWSDTEVGLWKQSDHESTALMGLVPL